MESTLIVFRFAMTFVLAFLFGYERQMSKKPVGFGTFIFVALGSCGLSMAALSLSVENPLPLLGAIVTGIGFLGAGALIKTSDKIFGFTTAAAIWVFAILGLLMGVGEYLMSGMLYVLIWIVIIFDKYLENEGMGSYQKKISLVLAEESSEVKVRSFLREVVIEKTKLVFFEVDNSNKKLTLSYIVEGDLRKIKLIPKKVMELDWIDSCKVE